MKIRFKILPRQEVGGYVEGELSCGWGTLASVLDTGLIKSITIEVVEEKK